MALDSPPRPPLSPRSHDLSVSLAPLGWLALLAPLLSACLLDGPTMSAARRHCLHDCARDKDACILAAQTAGAIQQCDARSRDCRQG